MSIIETDKKYVASSYGRFPVEIVSGKGALLKGGDGKEYIDMTSGIGVNAFGAADDEWVAAVTSQLTSIQHISNLYYTTPCALLAEALCEKTGMKKVFFGNSGAEANECAIKVARKWAFDKYGEGRSTIITLKNSFHGRTITTLAATGQDSFHTNFMPFTEGFVYASAYDASEVEKLAQENGCCAVMLEAVQGEGGVYPLEQSFVDAVVEICEKYGLLLIFDEVQTGNGRTGKLFGYMHFGVTPDIFTTAKGLGGGLPIGACVMGERTADVLTPGTHGSTFGGNPAVCAGALSIFDRLTDDFLAEVTAKGDYIRSKLEGVKGVKSISGKGLMIGIETERAAKDIIGGCIEGGVLVLSAKTKVRLLPPLNITYEQIDKAIEVLIEEIEK